MKSVFKNIEAEMAQSADESNELRADERGMTLIEVIAVITIIALLYVVVGRNVFGQSEAAQAKLNEVKLNNIKGYLMQYKLQFNFFPGRLEELISGPGKDAGGGVFVPLAQKDDLTDVWKNPLVYIPEGGGKSFTLRSLGSDGVEGGDGAKKDVEVKP